MKRVIAAIAMLGLSPCFAQQSPSELVRQFETEKVFWKQIEIAKAIVVSKDTSVLSRLEPWLTHRDRHARGNAAFIFAGLGDARGFDTIVAILNDRSEDRLVEQISSVGSPWVQGQIREDRYYAAHLLGDLKDSRAIPVLVSLVKDPDVNYVVPWSLAQIGGPAVITPLLGLLNDRDPSIRVIAIQELVELKATEAVPLLRALTNDDEKSTVDKQQKVADAARAAIAKLQAAR